MMAAGESPSYTVVYRPEVPQPNRVLLFGARVIVACALAACAWSGMAAAESAPTGVVDPTVSISGADEEGEPGLGFIGRGYAWLLENYTEHQITWIGSFVLHELAYFGAYVPWLICDAIPYCRRYKIQVTFHNTADRQWKCFKQLMFSHIFVQLPLMAFFHVFAVDFGGISLGMPLPSVVTLAWQIPVFFVIEDFYFYWIHRFLHWKRIYKYIHKVHHHHSAPFGIAAEYAHPVETLFLGLGTLLGPMFFAKHLLTVWVWLVFRLWETVEDHSGYILPWYFNPTSLIPFWGGADHHDFHHEKFDGNYADVFTLWDWVFGTDKEWREQHRIGRMNNKGRKEFEATLRGETATTASGARNKPRTGKATGKATASNKPRTGKATASNKPRNGNGNANTKKRR